ncbi:ADP-forming succinate--CoA ligase subunit beta [Blattabacterium cuenoti]|uniref:ADP-forming succinate--CoA ligase subunit beta n=1 Tax=Blattabacterium cuenoti TaxID=1653831 RepID=UPI00163C7878|nr:ADP-forming succinate--CoA ligase subunit beta [Blattabacterium cuenoti]
MNLYEYQGRELLKYFSIHVPFGMVASSPEEAVKIAEIIFKKTKKKSFVIKAQIHAGGRGKAGGIKKVQTLDDVYKESKNMLGKFLKTHQTNKKGFLVKKILLSEDIYISEPSYPKEHYLSILVNREKEKNIILYSKKGGINIESSSNDKKTYQESIDPLIGLQMFQIRKIGYNLGIINNNESLKNFQIFMKLFYKAYCCSDALLLEINPLIKTLNNKIIPLDVKCILDDNAVFRYKKKYYNFLYNNKEDDDTYENIPFNFLRLEGNIGCMVNGAGLAMATMDMIKSCGGLPANFLDIGGSADKIRVEQAFSILLQEKSIKAILINIFGGIVRCDTVALGIISSYQKNIKKYFFRNKMPLIVRLKGTNENKAKKILENSSLSIYYTNSLEESANKIKEIMIEQKDD